MALHPEEVFLKVAVFGHYGQKNLGDEALVSAVFQNLTARLPSVKLIGLSLNPSDTQERHGVRSAPIRQEVSCVPDRPPRDLGETREARGINSGIKQLLKRRARWLFRMILSCREALSTIASGGVEVVLLLRSIHVLRGTDLFIIAGSNQIMDSFGGVWGFPYTVFKWTVLARLLGARVAFLSVGANPLAAAASRGMYRLALRSAHYISVRDCGSQTIVRSLVPDLVSKVTPDLAFSLNAFTNHSQPILLQSPPQSGTIGINLMPIFDPRYWPEANPEKYCRYVDAHAGLIRHLLQEGRRVVLFGSQPADEWVADDIINQLDGCDITDASVTSLKIRTVRELIEVILMCDLVVATRFHGILLSLRCGKPVIGINYYKKNYELLEPFGLSRFSVEPDNLEATTLINNFVDLWRERITIAAAIDQTTKAYRDQLARQYDDLLATCVGNRNESRTSRHLT